jgi:FkbM family methyltransferase
MINVIKFLNKVGFSRGRLKKINSKILNYYSKKNNIKSFQYNYHGNKFNLFPFENATDNKIIISSRKHESHELKFLEYLNKTNDSVFLDIGANMGYYSIMSSDFGFDKIYAIEPLTNMHKRIQKHIEINNLNNLVFLIPYALGDKIKNITLFEEPSNYGGSSLMKSPKRTVTTNVKMITLDKFIKDNSIKHIDAIKIDVEGYEDKVLMPFFLNSSTTIWPKLVIIEHSQRLEWVDDVIQWMLNNDYALVFKSKGNSIFKLNII